MPKYFATKYIENPEILWWTPTTNIVEVDKIKYELLQWYDENTEESIKDLIGKWIIIIEATEIKLWVYEIKEKVNNTFWDYFIYDDDGLSEEIKNALLKNKETINI